MGADFVSFASPVVVDVSELAQKNLLTISETYFLELILILQMFLKITPS